MGKEKYNVELKHLIPIKGLRNYSNKISASYGNKSPIKADAREFALSIYNVLLVGSAIIGIAKGLEALLK